MRRTLAAAVAAVVAILALAPATASAGPSASGELVRLRNPLGTYMTLRVKVSGVRNVVWSQSVAQPTGCHYSSVEGGVQQYRYGVGEFKEKGWIPGARDVPGFAFVAKIRGRHSRTWTITKETQDAACGPVPQRENDCATVALSKGSQVSGFTLRKGSDASIYDPAETGKGTRIPVDGLIVAMTLVHRAFNACPFVNSDGVVQHTFAMRAERLARLRVGGKKGFQKEIDSSKPCFRGMPETYPITNGTQSCRQENELNIRLKRVK